MTSAAIKPMTSASWMEASRLRGMIGKSSAGRGTMMARYAWLGHTVACMTVNLRAQSKADLPPMLGSLRSMARRVCRWNVRCVSGSSRDARRCSPARLRESSSLVVNVARGFGVFRVRVETREADASGWVSAYRTASAAQWRRIWQT
jgi:hypothetical protein